ncbi:hypothetical protein M9H77_26683 [Catharanthus roseus]|uniref:Uncharacterized protein n=1 Tax=Catharanthus roseus TaxID=4058 RepID=A0ACC0AC87_CATRO|nr:hypothetical protein M9H77_26683 [Catharanthus roseus]
MKFLESHEDHKGERQEIEIHHVTKSEGVNPLTHETIFVLGNDSLCLQELCKQLKENDEERRPLMEFKGNFKNAKRDQSLCYEKARMKTSIREKIVSIDFWPFWVNLDS